MKKCRQYVCSMRVPGIVSGGSSGGTVSVGKSGGLLSQPHQCSFPELLSHATRYIFFANSPLLYKNWAKAPTQSSSPGYHIPTGSCHTLSSIIQSVGAVRPTMCY
jgi:hypothetical protein